MYYGVIELIESPLASGKRTVSYQMYSKGSYDKLASITSVYWMNGVMYHETSGENPTEM